MLKQSKLTLILEIILFLFVAAGIGYYFYTQKAGAPDIAVQDKQEKNLFEFKPQCPDLTEEQIASLKERFDKVKEFLAKTPDHMGGWMEVGLIRKGLCDYQGAADVWTYIGEIRPENSLSFANLGDLYTHFLVDYPKAEAAYLRAIENEKHDVNYFRNFFELYYYSYTEKKHLAEKVLLDGLNYNPDSQDLMTLLASHYRDNGNKEKAIEYFNKVLKLNPDNEAVKRELERLAGQ